VRKKHSISLIGEVDMGDILVQLCEQLSNEQIKQFIIDLDEAVCDLKFSESLVKHFTALSKRLKAERY
jgi:hypothetical protein